MSNTSEEEYQNTSHRRPLMGNCITAPSKGDTIAAPTAKKRRSLPCNPDPDAEVVALSPKALLATNRYICEVCHKGFQRDQNLQLHRRGHNLPWKLKQRTSTEAKKRVYVCPEVTCAHHDPSRALGDLTGIKKHYSRKHGEKKWRCDKCSKRYAVQSDWKAHTKICGTKEYRCDCGTIFTRKDSFITHRAFCDALAEESYRANHGMAAMVGSLQSQTPDMFSHSMPSLGSSMMDSSEPHLKPLSLNPFIPNSTDAAFNPSTSSYLSATALLQKATEMRAKVSDDSISPVLPRGFAGYSSTSRAGDASNGTFAPLVPMSEGEMRRNECEGIVEGKDGRMAQDFFGLGPAESSYGEDGAALTSSYQHMSNGPSAMERPMWESSWRVG